jgi:hypothetical protein
MDGKEPVHEDISNNSLTPVDEKGTKLEQPCLINSQWNCYPITLKASASICISIYGSRIFV